ncbi:MAG: O-antigen ligase family protein [Nostoc sp. DedQUE12a]|nr:O-antigen ligase family protein [Nostoc sp. DedQUE12a]
MILPERNQSLNIRKKLVEKLELGITFLLFSYYLGINLPEPITQAWALLSFLTVPLLIIAHWKRFIWVATRDIGLLVLIATVPISFFWSNSPDSTLAYSRAFLFSTGFGIYLATRYTPKEQMRLMVWLFGIFTCLNFIVPLILPSYGINYSYLGGPAWQGITRQKNELSGAMVMISTFFLTIGIYGSKSRWVALTGSAVAFIILIFSKGKGSLGIFVALLPLLPLYKILKQEYRLRTVLSICALIISGFLIITTVFNLQFIVVDILNKDLGGNGRDQVWSYLIERGLQKPWLGYGYAGFWNTYAEGLAVWLKFPWIAGAGDGGGNAHSSYIEVFLHLGWLGLSLVVLSFFTFLIRVVFLQVLTKQVEYFWMFQFLLIMALNSFYESYGGFLAYRHWFWILYISYAYSTAIEFNRTMTNSRKFSIINT